jgi:chromosomal replication initiator protein
MMRFAAPVEAGRLSLPQNELDTTWNRVKDELRRGSTDLAFHLWLDPLELVGEEDRFLYVRAPRHIRALVEERHLPLIVRASRAALGRSVDVRVVGEDWRPPETAPVGPAGVGAGAVLNPRYTFGQFVIGDGNRLAHAAALTVAEQPAQAYNPLFLHGPPGLGKTHLLHAVGNYVRLHGGGLRVRYATSEEFTSAFVRAVRGGAMEEFKAAFRSADVLLVDDVQFLADRARTREEFFHTFTDLYESGCQLVLACDRAPRELATFETRMSDRFAAGLVAPVELPSLTVRLAILRKRARLDRIADVDDDVLVELARAVTSSVRALEGALIQVVAYASLRGERPSAESVRRVVDRLGVPAPGAEPSLDDIQRQTAEVFGTRAEHLQGRNRRPQVAFARQVAMYLSRELTSQTLPAIGEHFGGRSHSTVLHAHRGVVNRLIDNDDEAQLVAGLRSRLASTRPDRG